MQNTRLLVVTALAGLGMSLLGWREAGFALSFMAAVLAFDRMLGPPKEKGEVSK